MLTRPKLPGRVSMAPGLIEIGLQFELPDRDVDPTVELSADGFEGANGLEAE